MRWHYRSNKWFDCRVLLPTAACRLSSRLADEHVLRCKRRRGRTLLPRVVPWWRAGQGSPSGQCILWSSNVRVSISSRDVHADGCHFVHRNAAGSDVGSGEAGVPVHGRLLRRWIGVRNRRKRDHAIDSSHGVVVVRWHDVHELELRYFELWAVVPRRAEVRPGPAGWNAV